MMKALPLYATLGAQVLPCLAQGERCGSASTLNGFQLMPLSEVDTCMLIVWLGVAKFWVAKP